MKRPCMDGGADTAQRRELLPLLRHGTWVVRTGAGLFIFHAAEYSSGERMVGESQEEMRPQYLQDCVYLTRHHPLNDNPELCFLLRSHKQKHGH